MQVLAATAVIASAINIGGGFTITQRMLGMFRRPGDPDEHNHLLAIPGAALLTGAAAGHFLGKPLFPLQKRTLHARALQTKVLLASCKLDELDLL